MVTSPDDLALTSPIRILLIMSQKAHLDTRSTKYIRNNAKCIFISSDAFCGIRLRNGVTNEKDMIVNADLHIL